jgi:hypothetical protein
MEAEDYLLRIATDLGLARVASEADFSGYRFDAVDISI